MVMKHHHRKQTRRCAHCGQRFTINPRVGKRHRFCAKPACVQTSRIVARKRWLRKGGRQYFGGSVDTQRVRIWRQMNPKYWRRRSRIRRRRRSDYVLTKSLAATLRYVALQDLIDTHLALKIGMISHLTWICVTRCDSQGNPPAHAARACHFAGQNTQIVTPAAPRRVRETDGVCHRAT
jgi:hypothetical protein